MAINIQTGLMDEAVTQGGYYTDLTEYFSSVPEIARPFLRTQKLHYPRLKRCFARIWQSVWISRPITRELLVEFINYHFTILIYRFIGTGQRRDTLRHFSGVYY